MTDTLATGISWIKEGRKKRECGNKEGRASAGRRKSGTEERTEKTCVFCNVCNHLHFQADRRKEGMV